MRFSGSGAENWAETFVLFKFAGWTGSGSLGSVEGSIEALLSVLFKFPGFVLQKSFFAAPENVDPLLTAGQISRWKSCMAVCCSFLFLGRRSEKDPGGTGSFGVDLLLILLYRAGTKSPPL